MNQPDEVRAIVRERYGKVAAESDRPSKCCSSPSAAAAAAACCTGSMSVSDYSQALGYTGRDAAAAPEGANLGLGCGNPIAFARVQPGETVIDLGSGAGFDCFLAAQEVGPAGRVIGVDMTPEMLAKARQNAAKGDYAQVEFRLGEIEHLPAADATADVIISNCVVNLSPDKAQVFREAFRALKPGGRLCISDLVTSAPLPEEVQRDMDLHCACLGGASLVGELEATLEDAGFVSVRIAPKEESRAFIREWSPGSALEEMVVSALITAVKPA